MNALTEIKSRFFQVLKQHVDDPTDLLDMIRPAQDAKFGDYQANCAMPLGKRLGKSPRDVAAELVAALDLGDLCESVEVAGPGFINLKLADQWLKARLQSALSDERVGVAKVEDPLKYVVDFSSPNIAKEMHVGHIRSTVIGDAISRILRFIGHDVVTDNHLGDWGTQFGMIIYGYKHFLDEGNYKKSPVPELSRLYKYVRKLMDYHAAVEALPKKQEELVKLTEILECRKSQPLPDEKKEAKKAKQEIKRFTDKVSELSEAINGKKDKETGLLVGGLKNLVLSVDAHPDIKADADQHADIRTAVLTETSKLHAGDEENNRLWHEFLPGCTEEIQKIYDRLNIRFDHSLGESFYHDLLGGVVENFKAKGLSKESDGALCVFMENHDTPMIIQKSDGAYLYATTDLATIKYRMDTWNPDKILYVVDFRQGEHFDKLFDAGRVWGFTETDFQHVQFGTVLGDDGKPFKTRSGDTVGLEGLIDQAESRALEIAREQNPDLTPEQQANIASIVGIGGLKYSDLSINRTSDYKFSYEQMLNLKGNTATYLQYGYARVYGILRYGGIEDPKTLRENPAEFVLDSPYERALAVSLIRFGESLDEVAVDYKPNLLANYLYSLSTAFNQFFANCPVVKAETEALKASRLQLCDLTARTLKIGLGLLGIEVLEKM